MIRPCAQNKWRWSRAWNSALLASGLALPRKLGEASRWFHVCLQLNVYQGETPQGRLLIFSLPFPLLACLLSGRGVVGMNEINGVDFAE